MVVVLGRSNLPNENFWLDESSQFWLAKGFDRFGQPFSKPGNVIDVIKQNSLHSLDPGGFTVILHYWTDISNSAFWLRTLPYVFFVLTMITLSCIVYYFSRSVGLSLLSLYYLPILGGDLLYYAFELRPYSMEYFGVAISLLLFLVFVERRTNKNLLILNVVLAVFSTSRYSFIVFALIIAAISFILLRNGFKKILYYLPLVVSFSMVYLFSYRIELSALKSPAYTNTSMLKYLSAPEAAYIFRNNLLSAMGVFTTVLIITGFFILFFSNIAKEKKILLTALVVFLYNAFFCVLSYLGIYPWDVNVRWNLPMQIINVISLCVVVGYLFSRIKSSGNGLSRYLPAISVFLLVFFGKPLVRYVRSIGHYFRVSPDSISSNYHALNLKPSNIFYVSYGDIPTWRYLNEFGTLKSVYYPKNTVLGKFGEEPPLNVNYIIQSDRDDVNYLDSQHKLKYKDITVYQPTRFFMKLSNPK